MSKSHLRLSIPPIFPEMCLDADALSPPDIADCLSNQSSQESDWESDTESEDVETHYPSRASRAKSKTPGQLSMSSFPVSAPVVLQMNSEHGSVTMSCFCSSHTILKCTFCVDNRKSLQGATHQRTVRVGQVLS